MKSLRQPLKYLIYQKLKTNSQGFTLIELLVVVIIIGVLAAVAIPSMIEHIGKARESEAKSSLGTLARSQQAYHIENQKFASSMNDLQLVISLETNYYQFPDPSEADDGIVKHQAIALEGDKDMVRNYAVGVYHNSGLFDTAICQSREVDGAVDVPNVIMMNCPNNGIRIK